MGYWHPEARKQLDSLDQKVKDETERLVKEFEEEGLKHSKIGKVKQTNPELDLWRLKIDSDREGVNHRLLLDEFYDQFVYYGIYPREDAYKVESIIEVMERKYDS